MTTKECTRCKVILPLEDFRKRKNNPRSWCRSCELKAKKVWYDSHKNEFEFKEKNSKKSREIYHEDPDKARMSRRLNLVGLSKDDKHVFDKMLTNQNGFCMICEKPMEGYRNCQIDHCHATGQIRGLLCSSCNLGLGKFRDNPASLRRAADYIEQWRKD